MEARGRPCSYTNHHHHLITIQPIRVMNDALLLHVRLIHAHVHYYEQQSPFMLSMIMRPNVQRSQNSQVRALAVLELLNFGK